MELYVYGYSNGIRTSKKLEKTTYTNVEIMLLIQKLHPDFKMIDELDKNKLQEKLLKVKKQARRIEPIA